MSKKIILDEKYELGGGMGSWAKSLESVTINIGDVRVIGGILMYAYTVYSPSMFNFKEGRDTVNWTPVDETYNTPENLRNWLKNVE